ncbi:PIN domain-containing protein [Aurantimonas aggregata]|uniref:PIN domain-containing protein n=1 Tax=Aurantimonas aggregata TaxID=2047720 RepID=UPI0019431609|nr:PIN domain-containing protein [Aurantimonas aggregata]
MATHGTIQALNEADHAAVYKGDAVNASISKVEGLLRSFVPLPATDEIKARAADRAITATAPFHRLKNSIGDAVIIETYVDQMRREERAGVEFAFVTHNKSDFSADGGDHRQPPADLLPHFDGTRSRYWISLADLLNHLDGDLLANYDMELYGALQARGLSEIQDAEQLLYCQVWYNRHQNLRINIERGREKVVTEAQWNAANPKKRRRMITDRNLEGG